MIFNGHTAEYIDNLPTELKCELLYLWMNGLLGWRQQERIGHRHHQHREAIAGAKEHQLTAYGDYSPYDYDLQPHLKEAEQKMKSERMRRNLDKMVQVGQQHG